MYKNVTKEVFNGLDNSELQLQDRLKLLRFAWFQSIVHVPNKHQVLLEMLSEFFTNSGMDEDTQSASEDVKTALWSTLIVVLQDLPIKDKSLTLSLSILKNIVVETGVQIQQLEFPDKELKTHVKLEALIDVWKHTVASSSIANPLFQSTTDLMGTVAMFCQLLCALKKRDKLSDSLIDSFENLVNKMMAILNNSDHTMTLVNEVTPKILVPMVITIDLLTSQRSTFSVNTRNSLFDLVLPNDISNYEASYPWIQKMDCQDHPIRSIVRVFNKPDCTTNWVLDSSHEAIMPAIIKFMQHLWEHYLNTDSLSKIDGLDTISWFWKKLYNKMEDADIPNSFFAHFMESFSRHGVYDINNVGHNKLLHKQMHNIVEQKITPGWQHAMCICLRMNDKMMEDFYSLFLKNLWPYSLNNESTNSYCLLSESLLIYARKHQIPRYLGLVFTGLQFVQLPQRENVVPIKFLNTFSTVIEGLPHDTVLSIMQIFMNSLEGPANSEKNLYSDRHEIIIALFSQLLLSIRLFYSTISVENEQPFDEILKKIQLRILQPIVQRQSSSFKPSTVLCLSFCWVEVCMVLSMYGQSSVFANQITASTASSNQMKASSENVTMETRQTIHISPSRQMANETESTNKVSRLTKTANKISRDTANEREVSNSFNDVAAGSSYIVHLLTLQKLRVLLSLHTEPDMTTIHGLLDSIANVSVISGWMELDKSVVWTGSIFGVDAVTSQVALCHSIMSFIPVLPLFTPNQMKTLADLIVLKADDKRDTNVTERSHTVSSICYDALTNPACHELPSFTTAICHAVWKRVLISVVNEEKLADLQKSDHTDDTLFTDCSHLLLSVSNYLSSLVEDTTTKQMLDIKSVFNMTMDSVDLKLRDLLSSLKVLSKLPLAHLSNDIQTTNTIGILIVLSSLQQLTKIPQSKREIAMLCSGMLCQLLANNCVSWEDCDAISVLVWLRAYCKNFCFLGGNSETTLAGFVPSLINSMIENQGTSSLFEAITNQLCNDMPINRFMDMHDVYILAITLKVLRNTGDKFTQQFDNLSRAYLRVLNAINMNKVRSEVRHHHWCIVGSIISLNAAALTNEVAWKLADCYEVTLTNASVNTGKDSENLHQLEIIQQYLETLRIYKNTNQNTTAIQRTQICKTWKLLSKMSLHILDHQTIAWKQKFASPDSVKKCDNSMTVSKDKIHISDEALVDNVTRILEGNFEVDVTQCVSKTRLDPNVSNIVETKGSQKKPKVISTEIFDDMSNKMKTLIPVLYAATSSADFEQIWRSLIPEIDFSAYTRSIRIDGENTTTYETDTVLAILYYFIHALQTSNPVHTFNVSHLQELIVLLNVLLTETSRLVRVTQSCPTTGRDTWDTVRLIVMVQNEIVSTPMMTQLDTYNFSLLLDPAELFSNNHIPLLTFTECYVLFCHRLILFVTRYESDVVTNMSPFISICLKLQTAIMRRSMNGHEHLSPLEETELNKCAGQLKIVLSLLTKTTLFSKVAMFLVATYVVESHLNIILPAVKHTMDSIIFTLLDFCDDRAIKSMCANLDHGPRAVFKDLHNDYNTNHRFIGKI